MKKLLFMLIAVLSMALTGCSTFDSDPIKPNIIGIGNLQYEAKSGTWFVEIDVNQYTINKVTIPDNNLRSFSKIQSIEPIEGMMVTVFTSPRLIGVQAVAGKQSIAEIEELYYENGTAVFFVSGFILICIVVYIIVCLGIALPISKKIYLASLNV